MEVDAINSAGAQVGDRIVLYFETASLLKASFLLYVFPVIGLLLGALIGHWLSHGLGTNASATAAVSGFGFLILAFILVRSKANKLARSDHYKPKIIRVLSRDPIG
jgi:sigma-E factor negative regulatory protein RseC